MTLKCANIVYGTDVILIIIIIIFIKLLFTRLCPLARCRQLRLAARDPFNRVLFTTEAILNVD